MIRVASFSILMLTAPALATIQDRPVGGKPYSEQMDAANEMFLADLRKRLLQRGYEDVRVVPQMFVVKATEKGRAVTSSSIPTAFNLWLSDRITIEDALPSDQIKI